MTKDFVIEILGSDVGVDRKARSGRGALAEDHEDGFHSYRAERDVGAADANRDEKVVTFLFRRDDRAVIDGVRSAWIYLNVAFVANSRASFGIDRHIALNVMRIHVVGSHADRTQCFVNITKMTLGDDEIALHSSGFANIKLFGPVAVIDEFVFGESPR